MSHFIEHHTSQVTYAYKEGKPQLGWCHDALWEAIKQEWDASPQKFCQQEDAWVAQSASSTLHLGSGGWSTLKRDFVSNFFLQKFITLYFIIVSISMYNLINCNIICDFIENRILSKTNCFRKKYASSYGYNHLCEKRMSEVSYEEVEMINFF